MKTKKIISITCFVLSCIFLAVFLAVFVMFLVLTSKNAPSFAEAAKSVLLFLTDIAFTVAFLAFGVAASGVAIKLSQSERMQKSAKRLFIAEMVMFFVMAGVIAAMYVII